MNILVVAGEKKRCVAAIKRRNKHNLQTYTAGDRVNSEHTPTKMCKNSCWRLFFCFFFAFFLTLEDREETVT